MRKKIGILVFVLVLAGGGFFYWQNNQKDIRELNKNLPAGVKVVKNMFGFGNEYKVINKIDGYEFKVPSAWKGVEGIEYVPERTEARDYIFTSIELKGKEGTGRIIGINLFKLQNSGVNVEEWAKTSLGISGISSNFNKDKIGGFEIIKTQEQIGTIGYIYFFKKNNIIYTITGGSEEFIREIISNGKW
jgi:hypothetical protein